MSPNEDDDYKMIWMKLYWSGKNIISDYVSKQIKEHDPQYDDDWYERNSKTDD